MGRSDERWKREREELVLCDLRQASHLVSPMGYFSIAAGGLVPAAPVHRTGRWRRAQETPGGQPFENDEV